VEEDMLKNNYLQILRQVKYFIHDKTKYS